jgi:SAM-dependent methyltransferase
VSESACRFSVRAADYDRYRPGYPPEALDVILADAGSAPLVVDVGAGTGQATRALCERGMPVIAVEPNPEMRALLERNCPAADVRDATAERTGLPDACADVVTMFQAFQWCDGLAALAEFARIARPRGRLAVVWNVPDAADPFTAAYEALVDGAGEANLAESLPRNSGTAKQILASDLFADARKLTFRHEQHLDAETFRGRIRSVSYLPPPGPALDAIVAQGDAIFERFAGGAETQALIYRTVVILADRP